jgi:diguanylate cyclase (GGDEF)-like protein
MQTQDHTQGGENREHRLHRSSSHDLNQQFNSFLHIEESEKSLLQAYQAVLCRGADAFVEAFYEYLLAFPITSEVLHDYRDNGGALATLASKQSRHFLDLLSGVTDAQSAEQLNRIGQIHYQYRIEPVWIMGAYQLYLDHLRKIIASSSEIPTAERIPLESILVKLLFRDMGLMLEGYWNSAMKLLQDERNRVVELQGQVTSLLKNIPQVLWSVDVVQNKPLYISPSTSQICKIDMEMPIPCMSWTLPEDREMVRVAWQKALKGDRVEVESRVQSPGGEARWFRRVFHPFADASGKVIRIDGLMDDTTEAKQAIERLNVLATTDSLTGLPNRALLYDRLSQAIVAAERDGKTQVALMLMDLDHFKEINDTLGHPAGDAILREVSARLSEKLRESDTLARLGGDEFAILLPSIEGDAEAATSRVAGNLLDSLVEPFWYEGNELYLGASLGIALYPDHGREPDSLMSRADVAMYRAKHREVGFLFYDPQTDPNTTERLQLASDLRHALEGGEFVLYYQPQIEMRTGRVVGVEALIRWNHPSHGLMVPDRFLPDAERSGLIKPITDWVIETALAQCNEWRKQGIHLRVAVNVTPRSFQNPSLLHKLQEMFDGRETCVPPSHIEIEITENMLMSDIEHAARVLAQLRELGILVAVDDFGTGYSSLAYLKKLPIHSIKVDKSFVINMGEDDNDAVIVRSTIDLAHNLGCKIVAEGVETSDAADLLVILGCDHAQGFHICEPLPAEQLSQWILDRSLLPN